MSNDFPGLGMIRFGRILLVVAALAAPALSRPMAAEAQLTPADSAAVLLRTAEAFEARGDLDVAEAILLFITERYAGTAAARQAIDRLRGPESARDQRVSRLELPVFGTLYGMWLGIAVPSALDADESEAYGIGLLAGVPIGLFSALSAQRSQQYTEGQARAITWGGTWGTWQGLGWAEVLGFGQEEVCGEFGCFESGDNGQEVLTTMIFGGLAGIATGAVIARNPVRSGVSSAVQGASTWGSVYGAMVAEILDDDDGGGDDAVLLTSLLAGNAGLLVGEVLGSAHDVSRGRVRLINLGALGGGLMGLGIDLLTEPGDNAVLAIPLITSVAGLTIATLTTRDRDRFGPADDGAEAGLALLGYADGKVSFNPPLPLPTMIRTERPDGRDSWTPGLRFELFRAAF